VNITETVQDEADERAEDKLLEMNEHVQYNKDISKEWLSYSWSLMTQKWLEGSMRPCRRLMRLPIRASIN
jgi:hypothetical protein